MQKIATFVPGFPTNSSAFTSALKELDPVRQFKATAKLGDSKGPVFTIVLASGAVSIGCLSPTRISTLL